MGPYTASAVDMLDFWERLHEWSAETFGPREKRGPIGPLKHLEKEAGELEEVAEELRKAAGKAVASAAVGADLREEIADCLFLVFDAANRAGMSYAQLSAVCMAKLKKNKARTWPKPTDPNVPVEHVRD